MPRHAASASRSDAPARRRRKPTLALLLPQFIGDEALKYTVVLPVVAEVTMTLLALMLAELARPVVNAVPTEQAPLCVRVATGMAGDRALLEAMI